MFGGTSQNFFGTGNTLGGQSNNIFSSGSSNPLGFAGGGLLGSVTSNSKPNVGFSTGMFGTGGNTSIFGSSNSTGLLGQASTGIFGSGNTGASTPIFGSGAGTNSALGGNTNAQPLVVFPQNSPYYFGTQSDKFIPKKNRDDFEVMAYNFAEKYQSVPLKMLRLQDYANFKEGRIMEEHRPAVTKYFQTVKTQSSTTGFGMGSSSTTANGLFGAATAKPASPFRPFGSGSTGTPIGGTPFGTSTTATAFGTFGNAFGNQLTNNTSAGAQGAPSGFAGQTTAVNAFGMSSQSNTGSQFGAQTSGTNAFGAFGAGSSNPQMTSTGFGMFSGGVTTGFNQFNQNTNQNQNGSGMFSKPGGFGFNQTPAPIGQFQMTPQIANQNNTSQFYGTPAVQSNLNALASASASVLGAGNGKGPFALVYLPIDSLNLKKEEQSKPANPAKPTSEANKIEEDDLRNWYSQTAGYYAPETTFPIKKVSPLGENPLAKHDLRYVNLVPRNGELNKPVLVSELPNKRKALDLYDTNFSSKQDQGVKSKLLNSPKAPSQFPLFSSPVSTQPSRYSMLQGLSANNLNRQELKTFGSPDTADTTPYSSFNNRDPDFLLEVELAEGRSIVLNLKQNDLLAQALKMLIELGQLADDQHIDPDQFAFFRGSKKIPLTTSLSSLRMLPKERLSLRKLTSTTGRAQAAPALAPASLVPKLPTNYSCDPDQSSLARMSALELSRVENFSIMNEWARVLFLEPVDLRGLPIDQIVSFQRRAVEIYKEGVAKPPRGEGLNVPTRIEFFHFGLDDSNASSDSLDKMKRKIQSWTAKNNAKLLYIDSHNDTVAIETQGLPDED